MASLKQTLGSSSGNQTYKYPALASPYPIYRGSGGGGSQGASVNFPSSSPYATSAIPYQQAQAERPMPSSRFAADYNFDPVLARIQAMSSMNLDNAEAEAATLKKQTLIDAGDVDIARDTGADALTQEAVRQNTDVAKLSTLAKLNRDAAERARMLDEATNVQNLFYSGARQKQLTDQAQGQLEARNDFTRSLRAALAQIEGGRLDAQNRKRQADLQAALEAAGKLTSVGAVPGGGSVPRGGIGPGGGGPSGGGTGGTGATGGVMTPESGPVYAPQQPEPSPVAYDPTAAAYTPPFDPTATPEIPPYIPPQEVFAPPPYMEEPYTPPPEVFNPPEPEPYIPPAPVYNPPPVYTPPPVYNPPPVYTQPYVPPAAIFQPPPPPPPPQPTGYWDPFTKEWIEY